MSKEPLISVIMSVYNEENYIEAALKSLLMQTEKSMEIIIIDDCSTDQTVQRIRNLQDTRIKVYINDTNMGLTKNLNRALKLAKGRYIARMDGDDISIENRFEMQVKYLEQHPEVSLISCQTQNFGKDQLIWRLHDDPEELKIRMLVRPVLAHPGFMMRRELTKQYGYSYDESFRSAQDYDFAARVSRKYQIGIVPQILLKYRIHDKQVSETGMSKQFRNADRVRTYLLQELGINLSETQWGSYHSFVQEKHCDRLEEFEAVSRILNDMISANQSKCIYPQKKMEIILWQEYYLWVIRNKSLKIWCQTLKLNHAAPHHKAGMNRAMKQIISNKM